MIGARRRGGHRSIVNDDTAVTISVGDASVVEGNGGTTAITFPVTLSESSDQVVTATFNTADGSATAPADYQAATGTVTFPPGARTQVITVNVHGDTADESDETFRLLLSAPTNATIARDGTGTIDPRDGRRARRDASR